MLAAKKGTARRPVLIKSPTREINHNGEEFKSRLLRTLTSLNDGNFSVRLPSNLDGLDGKVADAFNEIIGRLERYGDDLFRLRKEVGQKGKINERLSMGDSVGGWADQIDAVNSIVDDLSQPTMEMGRVIGAVAKGDLTQSVPLEVGGRPLQGEYLRTAKLVNGMVEQLADFSVEVIRVAREVGTEGKLGGQAQVKRVSGVWRELTESVNQMAGNLTAQVRNIAEVTIAVANGDLSKKITVDVRGEILQLKEAINVMVDQLRSFAAEVTRVAREVGTEGKLGGQAAV
ncbi:MAG: HAMP domain-containing protein, partial [Verrucomicrobiota bacterium]